MNAAEAIKSYSGLLGICLAAAILGLVILLFARNARSGSAPKTGAAKETRRGGERGRAGRNHAARGPEERDMAPQARPEAELVPAQPCSDTDAIDLDTDAGKTVTLSYTELGNRKPSGRFEITASEMLVFTDEIIPCRGVSRIGSGGT